MGDPSLAISIPDHLWHVPLAQLPLSARLWHVLERLDCQLLGDLQGKSYRQIGETKHCGEGSLTELKKMVRRLSFDNLEYLNEHNARAILSNLSDTISIPAHALAVPLAQLPFSVQLDHILQFLGYETLGDLDGQTYRHISNAKNCGVVSLGELQAIVRQLSSDDLPYWPSSQIEDDSPPPVEKPLSPPISIPVHSHSVPLSKLKLSLRLWHVLTHLGCQSLGDLHGHTYQQIRDSKHCGPKTIAELEALVHRINAAEPPPPGVQSKVQSLPDTLNVPPRAHDWALSHLPLSPRLASVLEEWGCGSLGDLHGKSLAEFMGRHQCGARTLTELQELLEQVGAGQFDRLFENRQEFKVAPLLTSLNDALETLPSRDREALLLRYGGYEQAPLTLEALGQRYGVTREYIRVLMKETLRRLRRRSGLLVDTTLSQMAERCYAGVFPLTSELLAYWLGDDAEVARFSRTFYVRLFGALEADLPVWASRTAAPIRPEAEELIGQVRTLLRQPAASLPFSAVLERLRALEAFSQLSADEFLAALQHGYADLTSDLKMDFSQPEQPTLRIARFTAQNWIQESLQTQLPEALAQVGHPLSLKELIQPQSSQSSHLGAVTEKGLREALRQHPDVRRYGHGYFGLKVWDDEAAALLVNEAPYVSQALAGTEPPVTFADLCRMMKIAAQGPLADQLWQTVHSLPGLKCRPDQQASETRLWHRKWRLEYLLCLILEKAEKPLSVKTIEAQLNARLKEGAEAPADLKQRLRQSRLFVCDWQGCYALASR